MLASTRIKSSPISHLCSSILDRPYLIAMILMIFIDTVMNIHEATLFEIDAGGNIGM